jgi:Zn-dependent protease
LVILAQVIVLFFAIGLHEYAHCKFADLAGDPTPRYYGRVTLNLFKHFDVAGALMILFTLYAGFGIGWGKPSPADPRKMRNPRWDWFISVLAGPVSNVVQATIYALVIRVILHQGAENNLLQDQNGQFLWILLQYGVLINLSLFFFNLIPFGPLDGHWLVGLLLPEKQRWAWLKFNDQIGMVGLFLVILLMQYWNVSLIAKPVLIAYQWLVGQTF